MFILPFNQLLVSELLSFLWPKLFARLHFLWAFPTLPELPITDSLVQKDSQPLIAKAKTSHFRHILIFLDQLSWDFPRQIVPLINQQRSPICNSQAGQASRIGGEQFRISQQGFNFVTPFLFMESKKSI
jgi:hypothetical protein